MFRHRLQATITRLVMVASHRSDQLWQPQFLSMNAKAVRLGMDKARAKGKAIGRPVAVDKVDAALVMQLRAEGKSWREIAAPRPRVNSAKGKWIKRSVGSIRRVYDPNSAGSLAPARPRNSASCEFWSCTSDAVGPYLKKPQSQES
jgi:hypothetical protein